MNKTAQNLSSKDFERTPCWKCDGSGRIPSLGHVHEGVCFACNGAGGKLTARGERQQAAYDAAIIIAAADVKVGDRINGGRYIGRFTVETVELHSDGSVTLNGTRSGGRVGVTVLPEGTVRRTLTREQMDDLVARCLGVQA